jgi:hypothetical protein
VCWAIPGAGVRTPCAGTRDPGAEGVSLKLIRRRSCSVLSAANWRERSSIFCRSVLLGGGPTLAGAGWGATSEMRSAQRAAASKLHSC